MSTAEKLLDSLVAVNIELRAWADANTRELGVQAEALAGDLVIEHGDLLAALRQLVAASQDYDASSAIREALKPARAVIARVEGGGEQ